MYKQMLRARKHIRLSPSGESTLLDLKNICRVDSMSNGMPLPKNIFQDICSVLRSLNSLVIVFPHELSKQESC